MILCAPLVPPVTASMGGAGMPLPATFIFPDTPAGNAGLCRFLAFQEVCL